MISIVANLSTLLWCFSSCIPRAGQHSLLNQGLWLHENGGKPSTPFSQPITYTIASCMQAWDLVIIVCFWNRHFYFFWLTLPLKYQKIHKPTNQNGLAWDETLPVIRICEWCSLGCNLERIALIQWIICETLGDHLIHWTCAVVLKH